MPPPRTPNSGAGSSEGSRALRTSATAAVTAAEADSVAAAATAVVVSVVVVPTVRRARALAAVRGCRCTLLWGRWVACGLGRGRGRGRGPLRLQGGGSPRGSPKSAADTVSGVAWVWGCVGVAGCGWWFVRMREACTESHVY